LTGTDSYDVIVVGARCAGSPLAALLAREGLRVGAVEQATFPRDTLSTHCLHASALSFLDRLGLTEQVQATGAPYLRYFDLRQDDLQARVEIPQRPGDVGGIASIRRLMLDPILARTAAESGAEIHMATKVTAVLEDRGRVVGVRASREGSERVMKAKLVVGADGRNSTVASLVGARKYNLVPNERFAYWAFFEGVSWPWESTFVFHRWADRVVLAGQADSGLGQVIVVPQLNELPRFRADLEGSFMEYARSCESVNVALASANRVGKFFGMLRWEGFLRQACGPGWVLVGDAGHFKDPTPAGGIQDAFRQVEALAPVIRAGIDDSPAGLDRALAKWSRWRDRDASEHYWLACDMGAAGEVPAVLPELMSRLLRQGKVDLFLDLMTHRTKPSQVLTPPRLLGATGRLLARSGCDRRAVLRQVGSLIATDARRRRLNRRPEYAPGGRNTHAGATEVDERSEPASGAAAQTASRERTQQLALTQSSSENGVSMSAAVEQERLRES
jgi:2-polyprenyl-6-methoxyphenol hydroxylase-like FAD-dependent oxidoreductase